ncbi:MAG TPA: DoxX family protein [Candidatus Limnocylindria bacterium]
MRADLLAHVKWFTDPKAHPTEWSLLLTAPVLAAFAIALAAAGVAYVVQHRVREPALMKTFERFAGIASGVLGLHVGIALIASAALGVLFSPNLRPNDELLGHLILVVEAICGLMLLLGLATRPASLLLAILGIVGMQPFTFESILENVHILGIALFFLIVGRGPFSLDRILGVRPLFPQGDAPAWALTVLRVCLGFAIAFSALTEKLLDPALAKALLDERPYLNVVRNVGIGDPQFAYLAGLAELIVGVVIMSGQVTRPVMAAGAILFTLTLPVFGWTEFIGHLAFYGIMFVLFMAPNADSSNAKRQLRRAA